MGARVKICGIANAGDAEAVAALTPDFMGYIFWPGSKRFVKPEAVRDWAKNLPPIPRVGVFVDASPDEVKRAVRIAGLFAVQLHGDEPIEKFSSSDFQIWKVVKIAPSNSQVPMIGKCDLGNFQSLEIPPVADAIMLDTFNPVSPGGTGETGDWNVAREFVAAAKKPVLLAGGLTPENVAEAIRIVKPWGVDVSSGVEQRPGKKDLAKVARFIELSRMA